MPANKLYSNLEHDHVIQTYARALSDPSNLTKKPGCKKTRELFEHFWQEDIQRGIQIKHRTFDGVLRKYLYDPNLWGQILEATNKILLQQNQTSAHNLLLLNSANQYGTRSRRRPKSNDCDDIKSDSDDSDDDDTGPELQSLQSVTVEQPQNQTSVNKKRKLEPTQFDPSLLTSSLKLSESVIPKTSNTFIHQKESAQLSKTAVVSDQPVSAAIDPTSDAQKAEIFALKKMLLIISDTSQENHVDVLNQSFQSLPRQSQQTSFENMCSFLKNQFLSKV